MPAFGVQAVILSADRGGPVLTCVIACVNKPAWDREDWELTEVLTQQSKPKQGFGAQRAAELTHLEPRIASGLSI